MPQLNAFHRVQQVKLTLSLALSLMQSFANDSPLHGPIISTTTMVACTSNGAMNFVSKSYVAGISDV